MRANHDGNFFLQHATLHGDTPETTTMHLLEDAPAGAAHALEQLNGLQAIDTARGEMWFYCN